ncbi:MAG: phage terminase large subunit [Lacunisphaera sp.]|nr:phage terminase large subunit [Lacunisphaera sp.]
MEAIRLQIGPNEFAAQYQQRPAPPGGNLADVRKIKLTERSEVPADLILFRAWDLALTTKAMSDYSCGAYGGIDRKTGDMYLLSMSRGKRQWGDQKKQIIGLALAESVGGTIGIETAAAFEIAEIELKAALNGRVMVRGYKPAKDKVTRANPWLALLDAGKFHMVRGAWNQDFTQEVEQFPNGLHDDQVDAVSLLWEMARKRQALRVA